MTAIITGADSGIGRATAAALARRGHDIGITYRSDEEGARETAREVEALGRRAAVRHLDLTDLDTIRDTIAALADELGGCDVLVNNAGTGTSTPFLELELEDFTEVIHADLTGAFVAAQTAAKRMVDAQTKGRIIN